MIIQVVFEFVRKSHIHQGGYRSDLPTREHLDQIIHPIMRKDGDAIAGANPYMM